jgi:hypothetical protein
LCSTVFSDFALYLYGVKTLSVSYCMWLTIGRYYFSIATNCCDYIYPTRIAVLIIECPKFTMTKLAAIKLTVSADSFDMPKWTVNKIIAAQSGENIQLIVKERSETRVLWRGI